MEIKNNKFEVLAKENKKTETEVGLKLSEEMGEVVGGYLNRGKDNGEEYHEELVDLYMVVESLRIKLGYKASEVPNTYVVKDSNVLLMESVKAVGVINESLLSMGNATGSEYKKHKSIENLQHNINLLVSLIKELFKGSVGEQKAEELFNKLLNIKVEKWDRVTRGKGEKPKYKGFWGEHYTDGYLSNFYPSPFTAVVGGEQLHFNNVEHYFMYCKAIEFNDTHIQYKIKTSKRTDGKTYKRYGRQVSGYVDSHWEKVKYQHMLNGLRHKFTQNNKLKQKLISTGNTILVEASPTDREWGIGLSVKDKGWDNPSKWRGKNMLGKALMDIRKELQGE